MRIGGEFFEALHDLGVALAEKGLHEKALAAFERAHAKNAHSHELFYNLGRCLEALKRYEEALDSYRKAIKLDPDSASVWYNCGVALTRLHRHAEALAAYSKAIALDPAHAFSWSNLGVVLTELKHHDEALAAFEKAMQLQPDIDYLFGNWLHAKAMLCNWEGMNDDLAQVIERIHQGERACLPFSLLTLPASLSTQKQCSAIHTNDRFPAQPRPSFPHAAEKSNRLRLGYFSADFHNHATSYLMAELFELHDRSRFEVIGFSFGIDADDEMRQRLVRAFDKFIDVRNMTDEAIAERARVEGIHIAIDLKGFTHNSRPGIFACHAAPIQVSYLGYPGTMGATYFDYLIADKTVIAPEHIEHYTEQIVFMPGSYQVNDSTRVISEKAYSRTELGLPEKGFIFACFNNNAKITADVFDRWMTILQKVPGSVLWLFGGSKTAMVNLRNEARKRGVAEDRLIFAGTLPQAEHLARISVADLFLDTFHYNAHTTASDALWAGLPVLTCMGQTFASRVAASLLNAIGLPELITTTHDEYTHLAIELATAPAKLASIRDKLARNKSCTALFNSRLFCINIETAYRTMWDRHAAGFPPTHIHV
jgi:predicted O-linked N-acetylglucosamine transferase (SPINDLY family)